MSKVTMELVKELREKTQVGMMDCKKALEESNGDMERAIEILRLKGAAVAAKRSENVINNGHIESCIATDMKSGALLKIGCETDFSANTQDMKTFAQKVCQQILKTNPSCIQDGTNCLLEQNSIDNPKIKVVDLLNDLIAKIRESIKITEFSRFEVEKNGLVNTYVHPGANLGVLIMLETDKDLSGHKDTIAQLARDLCMQIVVTNPLSIDPSQVDETILAKERSIIKEQLSSSGKPANIIDKIAEGKLQKFFEEACLLNQNYIKNDKITIQEHINQIAKETGLKIEVKKFSRFNIGK